MLKPLIAGFITLHWQNAVALAAMFAGAAFMWDLYVVDNDGIGKMSGGDIGWWWGLWAIGVAVAAVVRWCFRRLRVLVVLGALDVSVRQLVVSSMVFLALTWYNITVEDPAQSLVEPYAVGAVMSWLLVWLLLFVLEVVDHYISERAPSEFGWQVSTNQTGAIVIGAIIFIDLLAFLDGWIIALLLLGALALFVGGGWVVKAVGGAPPSKQTLFY